MKQGTIIKLPDGRVATFTYHGLDGYGLAWGTPASERWNEPPDVMWNDIPEKQRRLAYFLYSPGPLPGFEQCPHCPTFQRMRPCMNDYAREPICPHCACPIVWINPPTPSESA